MRDACEHRQRRDAGSLLDRGDVSGRDVGLRGDIRERLPERGAPLAQARSEHCAKAGAVELWRRAQITAGARSQSASTGSSEVTWAECEGCDERSEERRVGKGENAVWC